MTCPPPARLQRLLRPKSIAVIGGREAAAVIAQCQKIGFTGNIWPVHPDKTKICGLQTFSSIEELPGSPDAAYVAVNRQNTIAIVEALQKRNAGGVICYASGFRESDATGSKLEKQLLNAAVDMPLIGPNCYGLLNYADGVALWPDQHGGTRLKQGQNGVAIITQSSNIAINMTMQKRGLPVSYVMTAGNQAQTGISAMALNLLDDPRVSALGLHIEGFDSISGFEEITRKSRALAKPVIALKIGRSRAARKAALTHTAALTGSDAAAGAFLKRIGIPRLNSVSEFLETLKLLHVCGPLEGYALLSMSCSGGEAGLMADAVAARKIYFRQLTRAEAMPVRQALGAMVACANPLDYHTYIWGDGERIEQTFSAMLAARFDLNLLVMDFPRSDRCKDDDWWVAVDAFEAALKNNNVGGAIVATMAENLGEETAHRLINRNIAPLCGIDEALAAAEAAADIGRAWSLPQPLPLLSAAFSSPASERVLDEDEAKALLAEHQIPVAKGLRADTVDEVLEAAEKIGFPVVLKALGIAHKSQHRAVRLNLQNSDMVYQAAVEMAALNCSFLVEQMISESVLELLIGVVRDEQFGMVLTIASGGIMVEVFDDCQTLLLPVNTDEIKETLRRLKSAVFFDGFRGQPKADMSAAINAISRIAGFAGKSKSTLLELDINPLIICREGHGAIAADALIRIGTNDND